MTPPLSGSRVPAEILLVEDNEDDIFLMRQAFRHTGLPATLHCVEDGRKCLAFLRREDAYADAPRPDRILLDLNLPVMDGRRVLAELAADARLKALPVVILTTSANQRDIVQMYELRCSSYIVKPLDYDAFERAVRLICEYWFDLVALPPRRE